MKFSYDGEGYTFTIINVVREVIKLPFCRELKHIIRFDLPPG